MPKSTELQTAFVRVAECLYRNQSSGKYYALIKRKGKQFRKSLKTQDRKLAERKLKELRHQTKQLTSSANERKTPFEDIASLWFENHRGSLKPSSASRAERNIKELNKTFSKQPISSITKQDCENWAVKRGKNLSASTFNKDSEVLKAILSYAVDKGLFLDNPALGIKRRRITNKQILIPQPDEFTTLLEGLSEQGTKGKKARHLVQLLAYSGMRLGEATRIIWREIDFKNNRFTVSG